MKPSVTRPKPSSSSGGNKKRRPKPSSSSGNTRKLSSGGGNNNRRKKNVAGRSSSSSSGRRRRQRHAGSNRRRINVDSKSRRSKEDTALSSLSSLISRLSRLSLISRLSLSLVSLSLSVSNPNKGLTNSYPACRSFSPPHLPYKDAESARRRDEALKQAVEARRQAEASRRQQEAERRRQETERRQSEADCAITAPLLHHHCTVTAQKSTKRAGNKTKTNKNDAIPRQGECQCSARASDTTMRLEKITVASRHITAGQTAIMAQITLSTAELPRMRDLDVVIVRQGVV